MFLHRLRLISIVSFHISSEMSWRIKLLYLFFYRFIRGALSLFSMKVMPIRNFFP
jgi:hypothetical protein